MARFELRPIKRFVVLLDDQDRVTKDGGVYVDSGIWPVNMDFLVVAVGAEEHVDFGVGDRVVVSCPTVGRKVRLDGVVYRVVRVSDILAVLERKEK